MKKMTKKALEEALAGESMAHIKYLAFSEIAEKDGYRNVSRLFRAIAYAEQVHATNHARTLGIIKPTEENLQTAIDGEEFEVDEMYPAYNAVSQLQKEEGAKRSIHYALEAEKIHAGMYQLAQEAVKSGDDIEKKDIYICPVCGYTHAGDPPDRCPVCGIQRSRFRKF
jgi:rubrerythrin